MGWGFSEKVREVYRKAGGSPVPNEDVAVALDLFGKTRARLSPTQRDMLKRGEIERVSEGVYRWTAKPKPSQIREAMWRIVRARRTVTVADMVEMAGAAENYAEEYLRLLLRRGIVRGIAGHPAKYQLVKDDGPATPQDTDKADRLRRNRLAKKEALAALDDAFIAINRARMAITATD